MGDDVTIVGKSARVGRNTMYLTAAQLFSQVSSAIYVAVLARYVLADGMGKLAIGQAATGIAFVFASFGLDTLLIRDVAQDRARASDYLTGSLWIKVTLSVMACVGLAIFASVAGYPGDMRLIIYLYAIGTALRCFTSSIVSIWQAYESMFALSIVRVTRDIINVMLSLLAIAVGASLAVIVCISVFANVVELALALTMRPMSWNFGRYVPAGLLLSLLRRSLPFAGLAIIGVAYAQSIVLILSLSLDQVSTGYFSTALILLNFLFVVPAMLSQALLPTLSRLGVTARSQLCDTYARAFRLSWGLGTLLALITIFLAGPIVRLIFGPRFDATVLVLQLISVVLFTSPSYISGALLNATNHQKLFSLSQLGFVTLQFALAVILIPRLGLIGAAVAYVLPSLVGFIYYTSVCHSILGLSFPWKTAVRLLATTGLTISALITCQQLGLPWPVSLMTALVTFVMAGWIMHIVYLSDISTAMYSLLPRRWYSTFMRILPTRQS